MQDKNVECGNSITYNYSCYFSPHLTELLYRLSCHKITDQVCLISTQLISVLGVSFTYFCIYLVR